MGAGASSLNVDDVANVAKTPVAYAPPLGEPRPVRATRPRVMIDFVSLTWPWRTTALEARSSRRFASSSRVRA